MSNSLSRQAGAATLLLVVLPVGEAWVWTLTDGAGRARMASGILQQGRAQALSHRLERGNATVDDAVALGRTLFPDDIGEVLAASRHGALILQLHPALEPLSWECAWVGSALLGHRFAVARQPAVEGDACPRARAALAGGAALNILRILPAGHAAMPDAFAGDSLVGAGGVLLGSGYDLVFLPQADCDAWARVPRLTSESSGAPVLVAAVADPAMNAQAIAQARRHCAALLVFRTDTAALLPSWWAGLLRHLQDGMSLAEAARQVRLEQAAAQPPPMLRVFGDALSALCTPQNAPAQQRQVTAVSIDIVDSTHLLDEWGAERYSQVLQSFHDLCARIVHDHGGLADDPQGDDGLMSYFGFPVAVEDAAPRAVNAAVALVQAVPGLGLKVRVGIATGMVAIERDTPVGISIHLAARLQHLASPGTVLLSRSTRDLIHAGFQLEPLPTAHHFKGMAGAERVWRVLSRSTDAYELDPTVRRGELPLAGRESEMEQLLAEWRAVGEGQLRIVLVHGEAGIGKSRLLSETRNRLAELGQAALVCHCHPDTQNSAFYVLASTLRRFLRLAPAESPQVQLALAAERMPANMRPAQDLPLLAALLSLDVPLAQQALALPPDAWREQTLDMLVRWFQCAVSVGPACLIVEDIHWIDPSTSEFLHRLAGRLARQPLLILASQRSEAASSWEPNVAHLQLSLRGLAPSAARWMARQACRDRTLPEALVRLLAARSDGVPLFVEESVRMALDCLSDAPERQGDLAAQVPATLQDLLMARVDRLGEAKPVAQIAAVLGRSFPRALLQAVVERHLGPAAALMLPRRLAVLQSAGLLVGSGGHDAATAEQTVGQGPQREQRLSFRHALQRDTAYQSLWQRDRRRVHLIVAEVLTGHASALMSRQPELLAYHLSEAGRNAEALLHWEAAARQAAARSANDEARTHYEHALDELKWLRDEADRDHTELRLQLALAARCIAIDGYGAQRVEQAYTRAAELGDRLDDHRGRLKAELGLHGWHFMRADFENARRIAQRGLAAHADEAVDPMAHIQARWALAVTTWQRGDLAHAVREMDECLRIYRPHMHRRSAVQDPAVMCLCYSAWGQWELGFPDDALARIERALALVTQLDHHFSAGLAWGFASSVHHFRGETPQALHAAEQAIAICEQDGFMVWLAHARMMHGRMLCEQGAHAAGLAEMQAAYTLWVDSGAQVTRPVYLAFKAEGLALAGRPDRAAECVQEALQMAERSGELFFEAELRRLLGAVQLQSADPDLRVSALGLIGAAHDQARAEGKAGIALRAALDLARAGPAEAAACHRLAQALLLIEGGHGTRDVMAARGWLESADPASACQKEEPHEQKA